MTGVIPAPVGPCHARATVAPRHPAGRSNGWTGRLARLAGAGGLFLAATGLLVTFGPFHPAVQWTLIVHAAAGVLLTVPLCVYTVRHWARYRRVQV